MCTFSGGQSIYEEDKKVEIRYEEDKKVENICPYSADAS